MDTVGYIASYNIGIIAGVIAAIIVIIGILVYKAHLKNNIERLWAARVSTVRKNREAFYKELEKRNFNAQVDFSRSAYYRTPKPIEVMAFKADLEKKQLAIGSFDDVGYSKIFNFNSIKGFAIIDGERNTTMESFSTGSAIGGYGVVSGTSHSDTYQETTIGNIKLKIEVDDAINPVHIFIINKYQVDVQSEMYSVLTDTIEKIKTFLTRLIEENKN